MRTSDAVEVARARLLLRSGRARELRTRHGLSLGDMARSLGTEATTYMRWERGERCPRHEAAERLSALLRRLSELDAP